MKSERKSLIFLLLFALLATILVCAVSWPGFMSFDSMYALKQARDGIETGGYPPMVSYIWFLCDQVISGQGGMFILQNLLVFFGVVSLGHALTMGVWRTAFAIGLIMLSPLTLGPMLVVWKDVAFAGWMLLGYAFSLHYLRSGKSRDFWLAMGFIIMASCFRLNGIAAALPAMAMMACRISGIKTRWQKTPDSPSASSRFKSMGKVAASFSGLVVVVFACVVISASWRLPDLKKITMATGSGWTQISDLIGISVCSERNLIPHSFYAGTMPMDRLRALYFPEHSQRSFGAYPLLNESGFTGNQPVIDASVQQARKKYFYCFLKHRLKVFQYSVGGNAGDVFYLTDPGVFPGVADTGVKPNVLTKSVTGYIQKTAGAPWARSIVFIVLASFLWFWAFFGRHRQMAIQCILPLAGVFSYLAASFFILPAADARYNFIVNVVAILCLCALWPKRPKPLLASLQD